MGSLELFREDAPTELKGLFNSLICSITPPKSSFNWLKFYFKVAKSSCAN